jgi:anaerobic dimethyl sulfoxide reductase subunit B (iron-sulfur subunit)
MSDRLYVVDIARCTGCQACSIACKDRANLADNLDWLSVEAHEGGAWPTPTFYYRVTHCFHCAEPPCVEICPMMAIAKQESGLVQIDSDLCVACKACIEVCPFCAIVIGPKDAASKCDGCADEIDQGREPACVRACPMRALAYGPAASTLLENRVQDPEFDDRGIGPAVLYLRR